MTEQPPLEIAVFSGIAPRRQSAGQALARQSAAGPLEEFATRSGSPIAVARLFHLVVPSHLQGDMFLVTVDDFL